MEGICGAGCIHRQQWESKFDVKAVYQAWLDLQIVSQFTVTANYFFLFLIKSQIIKKIIFFLHKNMLVHFILYFAHEFIQEMFLNNFH